MTAFQRPTTATLPQVASTSARPQTLTGRVLLEVIAPAGRALPNLPGWTLLSWPQARLGDLTLEASSLWEQPLESLLRGLRDAGFTPLGYRLGG